MAMDLHSPVYDGCSTVSVISSHGSTPTMISSPPLTPRRLPIFQSLTLSYLHSLRSPLLSRLHHLYLLLLGIHTYHAEYLQDQEHRRLQNHISRDELRKDLERGLHSAECMKQAKKWIHVVKRLQSWIKPNFTVYEQDHACGESMEKACFYSMDEQEEEWMKASVEGTDVAVRQFISEYSPSWFT